MHPFTGLATREDGAIQVCCRSHPIGFIQDQTLEEIWNNGKMRRIRRQVLTGERPPECEPCFSLEDQGVESLRQRHIAGIIPESRIKLYPNAVKSMQDGYYMPFEIPTMELKLNNLCNLKCRMCHPMDSTSWDDWNEVEEFYKKENNILIKLIDDLDLKNKPHLDKFKDNDRWWQSLAKTLPYFRRVEFAGGEPLTDPTHYKILDMLQPYAENIEVKYATNLTSLGKGNRTVQRYWPKFKSIAVNVSIDGYQDSYEYVRGNASWDGLIANIKTIQTMPNISRIVGAVAVQVSNIMEIDRMVEYFLDELGIVFYTNMVKYPNVLSIQTLPTELKAEAVARIVKVKERLSRFKLVNEHPMLLDLTIGQLDGIVNFINAKDMSELWRDTIEFNRRLDRSRNVPSFESITPEFKPYV
jgi:molybdenum cofactor biosynthesis enzyme MoaA